MASHWAEGAEVPLEAIDDLGLNRVDFIKVDVEGMESAVLAGAAKTIRRCHPALYVENDRADQSPALIAAVLEFGYRAWWHFPRLFNPANFFGRPDDVFHVISANLLCLPAQWQSTILGGIPVLGPDDTVEAARERASG